MEHVVMRRFIANSIVNIVAAVQITWLMACLAFVVLFPCGLLVAAYFDPMVRVAVLALALIISGLYLFSGICQHIYEWAERSV